MSLSTGEVDTISSHETPQPQDNTNLSSSTTIVQNPINRESSVEFTSSVFIINVDDEPVIGRGHVSFSADEPSLRSERQRKPPKNFLSRSLVLHQRASIFWEQQAIQEYEDKNGWEVRYGVEKFTRIFFPKREHLPWWVFLFLLFFVLIPAVITICLFTDVFPVGTTVMKYIAEDSPVKDENALYVFGGIIIFALIVHLLDTSLWTSKCGKVFHMVALIALSTSTVFLLLSKMDTFPTTPIILFVLITPSWLLGTKYLNRRLRKVRNRVYMLWLSGPMACASLLINVAWIIWASLIADHWDDRYRMDHTASYCEPDFTLYPQCKSTDGSTCFSLTGTDTIDYGEGGDCTRKCLKVYDGCVNTFILWIGPLLVGLCLMVLSFLCTFLRETTTENDIFNFWKLIGFVVFAGWCAIQLAGVTTGIVTSMIAILVTCFVSCAILMGVVFRRFENRTKVEDAVRKLEVKYGSQINIVRGLLLLIGLPWIVVYTVVSALHQFVRSRREMFFGASLTEGHRGRLTGMASSDYITIVTWNWTVIIKYAVYWGIGYVVCNVLLGKFTNVFLSWLIVVTEDMELPLVTAMLCGVGFLMFLIPIIPGIPIYLLLGIVLGPKAEKSMGGYHWSIAYSTLVGLLLKLAASAFQQGVIGGLGSKFVSVRQAVGINSPAMKSIRIILTEPGFSMSKTAMLLGGPDWPTSVICGILGLDLFPILVATIPALIIIFPNVLTGALLVMADLKDDDNLLLYSWASTVSALCTACTVILCFCTAITALYYIEHIASTRIDEIEAISIDEEVAALEKNETHNAEVYLKVTSWDIVPVYLKGILILAMIFMSTSCYILNVIPCFKVYTITSTIEEDLTGDILNLLKPMGWVACGLFLLSSLLVMIFISWEKIVTNNALKEEAKHIGTEDEITA